MENNSEFYTLGEEIANAITHGLGLCLAIAGTVIIVVLAALTGDAYKVTSVSIYGATLICLYLGSTLYHSIPGKMAKKFFRIVDHSSIYLLIAGSYTPFTLISLRNDFGWLMLILVWSCAIIGIFCKAFWLEKFTKLSTILYIAMGWLVIFNISNLVKNVPVASVVLLALGGIAYTAGCLFFVKDKWRFNHAIWHIFVLLGSALQYFSMLFII